MTPIMNKLPRILFGLVILCFLLPFVNVSCSGQKVMSITGLQMLTGSNFQEPSLFGEQTKSHHSKGEPLAAIILLIAAFGFLPLLIPSLYFKIWDLVLSITGAALLLILKDKVESDLASQGAAKISAITINFDMGFWLSFLLFVSIFIIAITSSMTPETNIPK